MSNSPIEFEDAVSNSQLLAQLELIQENTYRTGYASRAAASILVFPAVGLLIGGVLALFGSALLAALSPAGAPFIILGSLVAVGFSLAGAIMAHSDLKRSR
jgi:hypothetical protein